MSDSNSKFAQIRTKLEQAENVETNFIKKFTENFCNFIECPADCIELDMDDPIISSSSIEYKAKIKLFVPVGKNVKELEFYPIEFVYDSGNAQLAPTYNILFNGKRSSLDANALTVFSQIYDMLRPDFKL